MANLFCVICRDIISIHKVANEKPKSTMASAGAASSSRESATYEDYLVTTPCGHLYHNNCLWKWFKIEETNEKNTKEPLYLMRHGQTDENDIRVSRLYSRTCPYCKDELYAASCTKLYPIEAPTDASDAEVEKDAYLEIKAKLKEQERKFIEMTHYHELEKVKINELNEKLKQVENEYSEIEEKWIAALRKLDKDYKTTKSFFQGILEALGYYIPLLGSPDLAIDNLVGQVLENREIIVDEPESFIPNLTESPSANGTNDTIDVPDFLVPVPLLGPSSGPRSTSSISMTPRNRDSSASISSEVQAKIPKIGDKVVWHKIIDNPMTGILKWIGPRNGSWIAGVEFEKPIGQNEPLIRLISSMFTCKPGHGRLLRVSDLMLHSEFCSYYENGRSDVSNSNDKTRTSRNVASDQILPVVNGPNENQTKDSNGVEMKTKKSKKFPRLLRRILHLK